MPPPLRRSGAAVSGGVRPAPRKSGGGFLWMVFLLGASAVAYAMFHFDESPQQVWLRIATFVERFLQTEPTSTPTSTATPTPIPLSKQTPAPTPTPAVAPPPSTAAPLPDPMGWLREHKDAWPKEVTLLKSITLPVIRRGKTIGSAQVPAGGVVQLREITGTDLTITYYGGEVTVPLSVTSLRDQAKVAMEQASAAPVPDPVPLQGRELSATPAIAAGERSDDGESDVEVAAGNVGQFVHPGVLLNKEDLERMKSLCHREPWKSGFEKLASSDTAAIDYRMRGPFEEVGREPNVHRTEYEKDAAAVKNQALMWYFTGKKAYAQNAIRILDGWTAVHKKWSGNTSGLLSGDQGADLALGAEILRHTNSGWSQKGIAQCETYFKDMIFKNDISVGRKEDPVGESNQGASHLKSMIAVAVFRNDREEFDYTVRSMKRGVCTSIRRNFLPSGQQCEAGRDQPHPLGAIANFATVCETAWKQGVDLYGLENNRLLAGMEYWAKYNLGEDVPFQPFGDCHNTWTRISEKGRGTNRDWAPVEMIYAHYVLIKKLKAPYTLRYREALPTTISTLFFRRLEENSQISKN